MQVMLWIGVILTLAGVLGLGYCVLRVLKAKRAGLAPEAFRAEMQRVILINVAVIGLSFVGLMLVILGLMLG